MRGRPAKSQIRQNIVEILYYMHKGHGYDIYKKYIDLFPKVTLRSIYYHLKKGLSTEEFQIEKVSKIQGDYSWGPEAELIYYKLGPAAQPKILKRLSRYFNK